MGEMQKALADITKNAASGLANSGLQTIGQALNNWIYAKLSPTILEGELQRIENEKIIAFSQEVAMTVDMIPPEKRTLPMLRLIGPAAEKAQYCLDEPELRKMFAALIASSVNTDKVSRV